MGTRPARGSRRGHGVTVKNSYLFRPRALIAAAKSKAPGSKSSPTHSTLSSWRKPFQLVAEMASRPSWLPRLVEFRTWTVHLGEKVTREGQYPNIPIIP